MSKQKLHVYIVHQCADMILAPKAEDELELLDHKILGVYLDNALAESHRCKLINEMKYEQPHIAVTKHTVRGSYIKSGDLVFL